MAGTRLVLVRHGQAVNSVEGTVGGPRGDTGLTERGRQEAALLRDRLTSTGALRGAVLYSSTLPRAVETATILSPAIGSPVEQHCGLCSYHYSDELDGMTVDELWSNQLPDGGVFRPYEQGNEAWAMLLARVGATLFEIAIANAGGTAVIVTHNEVIETSLVALGNLPLRRSFGTRLLNTSMTEWSTDDDPAGTGHPTWTHPTWTLVRLNDAAHLEQALAT